MKRIEPSRKHGPFDPRWIALRRTRVAERLDEEWLTTSAPLALKRWESEGGAVLADERGGIPPSSSRSILRLVREVTAST